MRVAKVAVAHPIAISLLDYLIPGDLDAKLQVGMRVLVPFGKQIITGFVVECDASPQTARENIRHIEAILDEEPLLRDEIIDLARWISEYYFNNPGDVLKSALPPGISVEQETVLEISDQGESFLANFDHDSLHTPTETRLFTLIDSLSRKKAAPAKELLKDHPAPTLSTALRENYLRESVRVEEKKLEMTRKAAVVSNLGTTIDLEELGRAHRQRDALKLLRKASGPLLLTELQQEHGIAGGIIRSLAEKGLADYIDLAIRRNPFDNLDQTPLDPHDLTDDQQRAYEPLLENLVSDEFAAFLLHGVTGSGKTEIYLHLIRKAIKRGGTALMLIPEISLTPQFAQRFFHVFGDRLAILHSGLSGGQRLDEWFRIFRGEVDVVLGTRLSVLSPLADISLIIVDEEHDQSYKQDDRTVFHARDVAVKRAADLGATCILGSATPSVESMANVKREKYHLLELRKRVFDRPLPRVELVDLRTAAKSAEDQLLPDIVEQNLAEVLERGQQAIVLVGRKGHTPFILCRACGHTFECRNCSISMSWHEAISSMKCHYCGRTESLPGFCPECKSPAVGQFGIGTARVEEYLKNLFPNNCIGRMDRDVVRRPADYSEVLSKFSSRQTEILVGTQMLAKGHDYPNVTAVVTLGIDSILRLPDFRHSERVFQLLTQVSGRAGRGDQPGRVFICTYKPKHFAIKSAAELDFDSFYQQEFEYRRAMGYPPFGYLTLFTVEHYRKETAMQQASSLMEKLHSRLQGSAQVLGPALAPYARLRNRWRYQLIVKSRDRTESKTEILRIRDDLKQPATVKIVVDPVSVM